VDPTGAWRSMSSKKIPPTRLVRRELNLTSQQLRLLEKLAEENGMTVDELRRRVETRREFGNFDFDINGTAFDRAAAGALEAKRESNKRADEFRTAKLKPGQQRRNGRARVRTPDENAPNGYREAIAWEPPQPLERVVPSQEDQEMREKLANLVAGAAPFNPDRPLGGDKDEDISYPSEEAERRIRAKRGTVPAETLARIRAAYAAAFDTLPSQAWQDALRSRVSYALHYRQAGDVPPHNVASNGRTILAALHRNLGETRVPKALTAAKIESVLRTSTLMRGGGRRPKKNVGTALDELIAEVETQL
jgi:hypothetical protein